MTWSQLDLQRIEEKKTKARELLLQGLTRKEVAAEMGIPHSSVQRYCKGLPRKYIRPKGIRVETTISEADYLKVLDLISGSGSESHRYITQAEILRDLIHVGLSYRCTALLRAKDENSKVIYGNWVQEGWYIT